MRYALFIRGQFAQGDMGVHMWAWAIEPGRGG